jgi:hypothetical protein
MSKLSEYSKFDHLDVEDDDDDDDYDNDYSNKGSDVDRRHVASSSSSSKTQPDAATSTIPQPSDDNVIRHVRKHPVSSSSSLGVSAASQTTTSNSDNLRFLAQYNGQTVYEWEQSLNEVMIYIVSPIQRCNDTNSNDSNTKIVCHISATHLQVGIQQQQKYSDKSPAENIINYYIDEDIYYPIETKESTWCIEQEDVLDTTMMCGNVGSSGTHKIMQTPKQKQKQRDVITIYLQKVAKGMVWEAPLRGHSNASGNTTNRRDDDSSRSNSNNSGVLDPISLQEVQKSLLLERWQEENPGMDFRDATFNGGSVPDPRTYMGGIGYQ